MEEVCRVLERLVEVGFLSDYAIGGATAAGFHGEPLATRDIDVFVFLKPPAGSLLVSLDPLFARLRDRGFSEFEEEGLLIHGFPVQFLCASPGLETEAVTNALVVEWDHSRLRVIGPEHLAAMALTVGRPKDRARVVYLTALLQFDLAKFIDITDRYLLMNRWREWAIALGLTHESRHTPDFPEQ